MSASVSFYENKLLPVQPCLTRTLPTRGPTPEACAPIKDTDVPTDTSAAWHSSISALWITLPS